MDLQERENRIDFLGSLKVGGNRSGRHQGVGGMGWREFRDGWLELGEFWGEPYRNLMHWKPPGIYEGALSEDS